jgi:cyanophycin synthetase
LTFVAEARRVTGPGMLWQHPGAMLDVEFAPLDPAVVGDLWRLHAGRMLEAVGWGQEQVLAHVFQGGMTLAISAPEDQLYTAVSVAEAAWGFCVAALQGVAAPDFAAEVERLRAEAAAEANPALLALMAAARGRGLDVLVDDDLVTVGHGVGSAGWPVRDLPEVVDWDRLHNIPVALITGTNGKTTTTRLCAAIGRAAGLVAGLTSTDYVQIGERVLEEGDFSGPGGARMLLRDTALEVGFLEVARGGILRRGLPVGQARAAAVLNVAADHLGEYGVNTVEALAEAKFAVRRGLGPGGVMVLNADDPLVVAQAQGPAWWFALTRDAARLRAGALPCAWLEDDALVFWDGAEAIPVIAVADLPIALGGRARHNIQNALAAICLTRALGVGFEAIRAGLAGFQSNVTDNPGRCNEFAVKGARVFVDFAHNPHSIAAVTQTLAGLTGKRCFVMISQAGDRSDEDIRGLVRGAFVMRPDYVVASELPGYERGRGPGETSDLIARICQDLGMAAQNVLRAAAPAAGAALVVARLEPDDLALLLVHGDRDEIFAMLTAQSDAPTSSKLA